MWIPVLHRLLLIPLLLLLFSSTTISVQSPSAEAEGLLRLKHFIKLPVPDPLSSWTSSPSSPPCSPTSPWPYIICEHGAVAGIRLGELNLSGTIDVDALKSLPALRSVYFSNNSFSGPIPPFSRLDALKAIYISNNNFSGPIPVDFFDPMDRVKKLWFDGNAFTGPIPSSLAKATNLKELHLESNQFSGTLPDLNIPSLTDLNLADNKLTGPIPAGLAKKFGPQPFQGNSGLCGPPVSTSCNSKIDDIPSPPTMEQTKKQGGVSGGTIFMIFGLLLLFACVAGVAVIRSRQRDIEFDTLRIETDAEAVEAAAAVESCQKQYSSGGGGGGGSNNHRRGYARSNSAKSTGGGGGKSVDLVMVNEEKGVFGMGDLMKAAAEVLGNGGLGSAYKAVMGNGVAVAVKRTRELNRVGKDVFDGELRKYGRLRHKNVLPPLAYHFRKEEKLVVSEYVARGSLLYILHGDRGTDHVALDWPTRLKIIRGLARGMAFLHIELANLDVPHANLKSGNILLDHDFEPLLVDFGFISLVNPAQAPNILFAYKSPEALLQCNVSPKSDVYCLGIILLEIIIGKFPSQYLNNAKGGTDVVQLTMSAIAEQREVEVLDPNIMSAKSSVPEMVRLLKVGVACTEANPDERPEMKEVAELVEEIAASSSVIGNDNNQERGSLPDQAPTMTIAGGPMMGRIESTN